MFATPRYVLKGGALVVEEGQLRRAPAGRRLHVRPGYDDAVLRAICAATSTRTRPSRSTTTRCGDLPDEPLPLERRDEHPRRAHRGHLRRGVHHARGARGRSPRRNPRWARAAALKLTGFATSVIACKCEAGDRARAAPDRRRPTAGRASACCFLTMGRTVSASGSSSASGRPCSTCPTTTCFDGLPDAPDRVGVGLGAAVVRRRFQISKVVGGERFWRIPVMEGEFLVQEKFGMQKGVGGGNFLILAGARDAALAAAEAAVDAMAGHAGVILPFPGGVVRSGSKVGARRFKSMIASTNDAYCPTLRAVDRPALPEASTRCWRSCIDGLDAAPSPRDARRHRCRLPRRRRAIIGRQLRRQARPAPLPPARDHGREGAPRERLRRASRTRAGGPVVSAVLAGAWTALRPDRAGPAAVACRPGRAALGEVCEVTGTPDGTIGSPATSAGSTGGAPASSRARAGGRQRGRRGRARHGRRQLEVRGDAGARAGAAAPEARRGMTGGEIVVHGSAGASAGARMRRGPPGRWRRVDHDAAPG